MEQKPETTDEKKVEDVPSPEEILLSNKKVVFSLNVIVTLLVALSAGALIGLAIFRNTEKEVTPVQLDRQAAVAAPAYKPVSSAVKNVQQKTLAQDKDEKKAHQIKRHGKNAVKTRKQMAPRQVAQVSGESLEKTLQAAKEGNAEAQYRLGSMYARGKGVKKDMGEAYMWYRRAAGQGHEKARDAMEFVYE